MAVVVTSAEEEDLGRIFNTIECSFASMSAKFHTCFSEGGEKLNVFSLRLPFFLTQEAFVKKVKDAGYSCEFQ